MAVNVTPMISPGVRVNVVDQSQYTALAGIPTTNAIAIVGGAQWGPINVPTLITSVNQFTQIFSTPIDHAGLAATKVLQAGGTIYYCRFGANATAMTGTLAGTSPSGNITITATQKGTLLPGTWKADVAAGSSDTTFKLTITRTEGTNEPVVMFPETELSVTKNADNYFENWNNDYFELKPADDTAVSSIGKQTVELTAGTNGITKVNDGTADVTAIKAALDTLSDRETYEFMYLSAPSYSITADIATELGTIAADRKDCVVQIDHDPNPNATAYLDSGTFSINRFVTALSAYATTPYVGLWAGLGGYVIDPYQNNTEILVPVSVYLLPALATEYATNPVWTAPAGAARLSLSELTTLGKVWSQSERDVLYAANINPITNYKGLGYTSMGQKSGQKTKSAMDRLNVVQLVNYVRKRIERISVDFLFAPIDESTFSEWVYRVSNFLNTIKSNRGLYDFRVKMDWETVTPDAINNNLMPGIVQIKPTKVAEFIDVDLVIKNYSDSME